ncbi:polyubiquitin-C [Ceratobasidium sp. AG-Ba]|nr:polyubiquitin-C [Ceratobasidium sp. AG-Ba]
MASPTLPDELVPEILCHIIPSRLHTTQALKRAQWDDINNLSLTSRLFRRAAFSCWFYSVFVRQPSDWDMIETFPPVELINIISRLHVFPPALDPKGLARMARYTRLKYLSVNVHIIWSEALDSPHRYFIRDLVQYLPSSLIELEVSCMPPEQCEPNLLSLLSVACPSLQRLGFYSASNKCIACAEEITLPFPIPEQFPNATDLADAFATSLSSLKSLRSLTLPIHLSHADIYVMHLSGGHPLRRSFDGNDCPRCVAEFGLSTQENEQTVADRLGETLPGLEKICFATWVYGNGKGGMPFARSITGDGKMNRGNVSPYAETQQLDGGPLV